MIDQVPEVWLGLLVVVGAAVGATLSAGEAALARITRAAAGELAATGHRPGATVVRLVERRAAAMAATAFVRLLAEMTAAVCLTLVVADLLPRWWQVLAVSVVLTAVLVTVPAINFSGYLYPAATIEGASELENR